MNESAVVWTDIDGVEYRLTGCNVILRHDRRGNSEHELVVDDYVKTQLDHRMLERLLRIISLRGVRYERYVGVNQSNGNPTFVKESITRAGYALHLKGRCIRIRDR